MNVGHLSYLVEEPNASHLQDVGLSLLRLGDTQALVQPTGKEESPNGQLCCCPLYLCCIHLG